MRRRAAVGMTVALIGGAAAVPELSAQVYTRVNKDGVIEATNIPVEPGFRLTYPGKGTLIHSRGFRRGYNGQFDAHILDATRAFGVSPDLVRAVIQAESEFDNLAVSSKGAQGLMQLMPFTARRFGVMDSFDPRQNIFGGVQYLRFLLDMFQGNVTLALAGYNAGENAVVRHKGVPPYRETRGYVQKIQALLGGNLHVTSAVPVTGFAPGQNFAALAAKPAKVTPARPRVYYKWRDESGVLHFAHTPPPDGVTYSMLRALD